MESNQWEDQLRNLLGEYKSPDTSSPLETPAHPLHLTPEDNSSPDPDQIQAWKRIEASLDAADQAFDETISQRVKHFNPPYDSHSWPVLLKRLAHKRYLRAKLILLKSVEVAILLLLILSAVNIERNGKLPFSSNFLNSTEQIVNQQTKSGHQPAELKENPSLKTHITSQRPTKDFTPSNQPQPSNKIDSSKSLVNRNIVDHAIAVFSSNVDQHQLSTDHVQLTNSSTPAKTTSEENTLLVERLIHSSLTEDIPAMTMNGLQYTIELPHIPEITRASKAYITEPIIPADMASLSQKEKKVPEPKFIKTPFQKYTEFAVLAQADYNILKMPEDRLFSSGREIVFPSKGIMSPGYGAGFTMAIGHPIWALETGVIYSAKDFKPGRQLIVGGAFDNRSVKFEAMKLQLVSLPVQYRYRFDHKGRLKSYAVAGGALHVIVQSNIDVQIKNHFASLSAGEDPNKDPNLAPTIAESKRIREHIRDGAPFSTKSFVSINAGLGMEYMLTEHKAIFLQTVAQYQIPNIVFSNNNGKHLRSVSIQAGIRGPLGK